MSHFAKTCVCYPANVACPSQVVCRWWEHLDTIRICYHGTRRRTLTGLACELCGDEITNEEYDRKGFWPPSATSRSDRQQGGA